MTFETKPTFTSPFETGEWSRWRNVDRCRWLRGLLDQLRAQEQRLIENGFKPDKKKVKRLAEALKILEAKLKEEIAINDKARAYADAMVELGMDAMLKIETEIPVTLPGFGLPKRPAHKGN